MALFLKLLSILLAGSACLAQSVTVGALGGVRVTDDLSGIAATGVSKRYVVGPSVDIGLLFGLAFEADALYRRNGYESRFSNYGSSYCADQRSNSWEFPLLVKYRLPLGRLKPFVEAGYAPRVMHGTIEYDSQSFLPPGSPMHTIGTSDGQLSHGFVTGGGLQVSFGRFAVAPTLRYARWNNVALSGNYSNGPSFQSTQNQADVMMGLDGR